jgi:hypothetical protein
MLEYERIVINITFHEGVRNDRLKYDQYFKYNLAEWIKDLLVTTCSLKREEADVDMVSIEKFISEILYEEEEFRIVSTKNCNALVQRKVIESSDKMNGYSWKDHAWFGTGAKEECIQKAKDEIHKIKTKKKYKAFISGEVEEYQDKPLKRTKDKVSRLSPAQIEMLKSVANETSD